LAAFVVKYLTIVDSPCS